MTNARSIINQAARKIAVFGRGQSLSADDAQDALTNLNGLVSSLSTDVGTIFNSEKDTFALDGSLSYTVGAGGDFNIGKPVVVNAANVLIGTVSYPLRQLNEPDYAAIGFKNITGIPEAFYYENNTPLATIYLYPVGVAGYSLTLYTLKALTEFADLTTNYNLPPGFDDLLVYNLAKRLCTEYEKPVPAEVAQMAQKTITNVQGFNKRNNYPTSYIDVAGSSGGIVGNIYSGWYTK